MSQMQVPRRCPTESPPRMGVSASIARLRQTKARDFIIRFVFGGVVTVATGLIATRFGPVVGGLFLAFPAILPASLTLLAQHARNTQPAGADAYGSIFGSVGLLAFAAVTWALGIVAPAWLVLLLAMLVWIVTACGTWAFVERLRRTRREQPLGACRGVRLSVAGDGASQGQDDQAHE